MGGRRSRGVLTSPVIEVRQLGKRLSTTGSSFDLGLARTAVAAATPFGAGLLVVLAMGKRLLLQKSLTICNRNLIIVRMNLRKSEETVPVAAVVDKRSL